MSDPQLDTLFQPLQLRSITLKNRVFMSSMTHNVLLARAAGGAGLIIADGILISQQGTKWHNAPGIWSKDQIAGWKKVADAVHAEGSIIYAQVSTGAPGCVTPTAIENPREIIAVFKQAAINAKNAGFDGVEIHAANGYLIPQFLDRTSSHRTDEWGGRIENRSQFGLDVLKTAIEVWSTDRVGIKLNPTGGYNDVRMPLEETLQTFSYFSSEVDKLKIAYVTLVRYAEFLDPIIDGSHHAVKHDVISTYAPLLKNALVFGNAAFTGEEAARYVPEGKLAGVFFGVPWIALPDFARLLQDGKPLDGTLDFTTCMALEGT
ncbi:FMN-linked oxidoreductase [Armillaria gallica]|uniref:FMN-linked oxidoreductase n=1 Tax=Armillaria gallica TaxID=47427 RepID=A0A2H3E8R4_ARMGA|nr:FMN-linked oxidoreductase [Armillaria gallica]